MDGDSRASLGNLIHCSTTLTVKKFILMYFCYCSSCLLPLALSRHTTEKGLDPSSLLPHQVFVHMGKISLNLLFSRPALSASPLMADTPVFVALVIPPASSFSPVFTVCPSSLTYFSLLADPTPLGSCPAISSRCPQLLCIAAFQIPFNLRSVELTFSLRSLPSHRLSAKFFPILQVHLFFLFCLPSRDARKLPDYEEHGGGTCVSYSVPVSRWETDFNSPERQQ